MDHLFEKLVGLAVTIYGTFIFYRVVVWLLKRASGHENLGKFVSAEQGKGGDKFRLSLGNFFTWNVAVNAEKATLESSSLSSCTSVKNAAVR